MTKCGEAEQRIEAYLGRLRQRMRGMKDEEARDILEEIRSHIMEKASASGELTTTVIDSVLAALGSPEELASEYLTDSLLARAEVSRSPWLILRSLFRWATLSVAGFFVLLGSVLGYFLGIVFMLVAIAKIAHPRTAGLWAYHNSSDVEFSFRLGFAQPPPGGHDVMGWWIIPVGWLVGAAVVMLTTSGGIWFVRQYRKSLNLP